MAGTCVGIKLIKEIFSVFLLLTFTLQHSRAVTITKLALPGADFEPIIGKGIATFLTPDEAARVRRQQASDVIRASYNTDKEPSDSSQASHRSSEPGFYGVRNNQNHAGSNSLDQGGRRNSLDQDGRNRFNGGYDRGSNRGDDNDRRGGERNSFYDNEIPDVRRYQDNDRDYYPKFNRGGDTRKFSDCRGPRCGPDTDGNDNLPPRVLFIHPDPGYHTSLTRRGQGFSGDERRGPGGYQGDERRGPEDYQGNDRRGPGGYWGDDRRRPWDYQGNEYQGMNLRRGPRPENYPGGTGRWDTPYRNTDPPGEINRIDRLQGGSFYGEPEGTDRDRRPTNRDNKIRLGETDRGYRYNGADRYQGESSYRAADSRRPVGDNRRGRWARECKDTPGLRGCQASGEELGTLGFYGTSKRN